MDLDAPRAVHVATRLADVVAVLAEADRAAARGQWAAVMIAYEAAAAFDPAMASAVRDDGELGAAAGVGRGLRRRDGDPPAAARAAARRRPRARRPRCPRPWTPSLTRRASPRPSARVAACIAAGDTYQVNYTFALEREGRRPD